MKSAEIRQAFLDYFQSQGHQVVASSPLVPANDPTLLFTNAGMVQFKDVFLGSDPRSYTRATSSQRCVRAGGKHNDLENVGYTARHHTFFEMLGNFSFGDYFKRDAIQFAWEFLTKTLGLPEEKLWVTVFHEDQEAEDIWLKEMGVSAERFSRLGEKDNFWQMGDTGPCGPCSEIFYDHGSEVAGGPPGSPEEDGDRYIEIWNLVFMQFDRQPSGELVPLPKPSVDTGMGLERVAAVMQGVHSNYEIDLFQNILNAIAPIIGVTDTTLSSLRVVADHIRSCAFLIADGVMPSNEGRGYVLRRIIRRAIRHGNKLGQQDAFFYLLVPALVKEMGEAYPELANAQQTIEKVLRLEEEQFIKTLDQGLRLLEQDIEKMSGTEIPGAVMFKLYDTYGFPADLTGDIARERNLTLDMDGFNQCMDEQRRRGQESNQFKAQLSEGIDIDSDTEFCGYDHVEQENVTVVALFKNGEAVESLNAGDDGIVVLDNTPFYAESGGQVGDTGTLTTAEGVFAVMDTQKQKNAFVHSGTQRMGALKVGDTLTAKIDQPRREAIKSNHSATHLMHAALREILGDHVQQKGSLVNANRLRFDFSHLEAVSKDELRQIEDRVNQQIRANTPVTTELMDIDSAREKGAMALFGEKYGDEVRVLSMGEDNFSVELCGGTHVARTGDIGLFHIVSETGTAAGVRRIEAVTGQGALEWYRNAENTLSQVASLFKADQDSVFEKAQSQQQKMKALEKEIQQLQAKLATGGGSDIMDQVQMIGDVKVLAIELEGVPAKALRDSVDQFKNKLQSGIVVLGSKDEGAGKVSLIAGVTKDLTGQFKAGELVNHVAQQVGGKGGGRPDMAQAGGSQPENLKEALASVASWVESATER